MTAFIESFATRQLLPPWQADGVQTWLFQFPLARNVVKNYVDRFFNLGREDEARYCFEAHADDQTFGLLVVSRYPEIASVKPVKRSGYGADWTALLCVNETQVSVVVPVYRYLVTRDNMRLDPQVYYFQPFAISDNSSMVFANREIIGTDMMLGQISMNHSKRHELCVDTKIPAIRKFDPRSKETLLPFLRVATGRPRDLPIPTDSVALEQFLGMATKSPRHPSIPTNPAKMDPWVAQTVALKQFRDTADLDAATCQAIVTSTVTYRNLRGFGVFDLASVDVDFTRSATTAEILETFLALKPSNRDDRLSAWDGGRLPFPLRFACTFTSDVTLDQIATLHTFGTPP